MIIYNRILSFFATLFLFACSINTNIYNSENLPQISDNYKIKSLNLYINRSSLNSTDFEQYTIDENVFIGECGNIKRNQHRANQQNIITLSENELKKLTTQILKIKNYSNITISLLPKQGNNSSLFDPGKFILKVDDNNDKFEIETSLDAISDADPGLEKDLLALTKLIRNLNKNFLCGLSEFYGVGL